jgi:hypothetical protein
MWHSHSSVYICCPVLWEVHETPSALLKYFDLDLTFRHFRLAFFMANFLGNPSSESMIMNWTCTQT